MSKHVSDYKASQAKREAINQPNRAIIKRILPEEEAAFVETGIAAGTSKYVVRHPYFGVNSWIRVMPEVGTEITMQERGDVYGGQMTGYLAGQMIRRHREAKKGNLLIRLLNPGEIELMSSGRAYLFLGDGGDIEMRGGMIRQDLLQTEQEHSSLAPTFIRKLYNNLPASVNGSERFGVVKRPDQNLSSAFQVYVRRPASTTASTTAATTATTPTTTPDIAAATALLPSASGAASPSSTQEFAVEYGRWLISTSDVPLASLQEGHVYDPTGVEVKQASTNKPLRLERILTASDGTSTINLQVDEELNLAYNNASTVSREAQFKFGSQVTLDVQAEQYKATFTKTGSLRYGTSLQVTSPKIDLKSANVNFGDNPIFSALLGDKLVNSILTPLFSTLLAFLQLYGADAAIGTMSPQTVASAAAAAGTLTSAVSQLSSTLSQQVHLSG